VQWLVREEVTLLLATLVAHGLLVLGTLELIWPTRPRRPRAARNGTPRAGRPPARGRPPAAPRPPEPPPTLPPVGAPTLGMWSANDHYLEGERMKMSGRVVNGPWRYEQIDGASHWIPLDAPDRLNQLLMSGWVEAIC